MQDSWIDSAVRDSVCSIPRNDEDSSPDSRGGSYEEPDLSLEDPWFI